MKTLKMTAFVASIILSSGAIAANNSVFPSAAEEGSGPSINAPLPTATGSVSIAEGSFPSAAPEGSESSTADRSRSTARSRDGNPAASGKRGAYGS